MEQESQNIYSPSQKNFNLNTLNMSQTPMNPQPIYIINKKDEHDEPGLYHGIGVLCFATATLLLGISIWDGYHNPKLLTIFGFFIGGLGQLVSAIMCFKYNYYIDGAVYFYFALNWSITTCYDLFPVWGWMEPLNNREYGFHNLMGCLFTLIFFLQNLGAPSIIVRFSYTTTFLGFVFSTIGNFTNTRAIIKIGGIFNIITAALAYYSTFGNIINERYKKIWMPVLDGKSFGQKLD